MPSLFTAQSLADRGQRRSAKEIVSALLQANPNDVGALELGIKLADTEAEKADLQSRLDMLRRPKMIRSTGHEYIPLMLAETDEERAELEASLHTSHNLRPTVQVEDYLVPAILTLAVYFFGAAILGFALNIYFLNQAGKKRDSGIPTKNVGCLNALLVMGIVLVIIICLAIFATLFPYRSRLD